MFVYILRPYNALESIMDPGTIFLTNGIMQIFYKKKHRDISIRIQIPNFY
jgi:hypothetical protein